MYKPEEILFTTNFTLLVVKAVLSYSPVSNEGIYKNQIYCLVQLQDVLKFGLDELLKEDGDEMEVDFEQLLGKSKEGQWCTAVAKVSCYF